MPAGNIQNLNPVAVEEVHDFYQWNSENTILNKYDKSHTALLTDTYFAIVSGITNVAELDIVFDLHIVKEQDTSRANIARIELHLLYSDAQKDRQQ